MRIRGFLNPREVERRRLERLRSMTSDEELELLKRQAERERQLRIIEQERRKRREIRGPTMIDNILGTGPVRKGKKKKQKDFLDRDIF